MRMRVGIGLRGQPFLDVGDFALRIVQPAIEQPLGRRLAFGGVENGRRRIERVQPRDDAVALCVRRQIGLGQHDAVGDRRLLHRFGVFVERGLAVDRIDHRHHAVEPVAHARR